MEPLTGMSNTRIYRCWDRMKHRCYNSKNKDYRHYGGRGIKVCDEWLDDTWGFTNFYYWAMNNGYSDNLTIDRIDVNGNYEPLNCRWATIIEQRNNMRSNVVLTYKGETHNLKQWSKILGLNYRTLCLRYERGWSVDTILNTPVKCALRYVEFNDEIKSVHEWADIMKIKQDTLSARLKKRNYDMYAVYDHFQDIHKGYEEYTENSEITE